MAMDKAQNEAVNGGEKKVSRRKKNRVGVSVNSIQSVANILDIDLLGFGSPESDKEVVFREYEAAMETGSVVELTFSILDRHTYMAYKNGVTIKYEESQNEKFGFSSAELKKSMLRNTCRLCVESVDRENSVITLKKNPQEAQMRKTLEEGLLKAVAKGEGVEVPAVVVATSPMNGDREVLLVDIAGMGIPGCVRLIEWSTCFTSTFNHVVKVGETINVVVCGVNTWRSGNLFDCSRRLAMKENPWKDIEKRAPHNSNVRVTCIDMNQKNFFGRIEGIQELNCYCEYPNKELNIRIAPGIEYVGYVSRVSEKDELLRVRITGYAKDE